MSFIFVCFSVWHEQQLSHQRGCSQTSLCFSSRTSDSVCRKSTPSHFYLILWLNIYLTIIDKCVTISHTEEKSKMFEHWWVHTEWTRYLKDRITSAFFVRRLTVAISTKINVQVFFKMQLNWLQICDELRLTADESDFLLTGTGSSRS